MSDTYINLDMELLFQQLTFCNFSNNRCLYWKRYQPTNRIIDKLFQDYYCEEFMENYYDSEPKYDDEEFKMYMDYIVKHNTDDEVTGTGMFNALSYMIDDEQKKKKRYAEKEHTAKEIKAAYEKIRKQQEDYNEKRIRFNNWQEPYFKGNWGYTQKRVDSIAKKQLKTILKSDIPIKDRLWLLEISKDNIPEDMKGWNGRIQVDCIEIYYYGRDYLGVDYCWSMQRRVKNMNTTE